MGDNWIPDRPICEECRKERSVIYLLFIFQQQPLFSDTDFILFLSRKTSFESTEITIHILKPTDKIPSEATPPTTAAVGIADSTPQGTSGSKPPVRTYGSRNQQTGVRQSKRILWQAKKQERQCRVTISRSTTVKELKLEVRGGFISSFLFPNQMSIFIDCFSPTEASGGVGFMFTATYRYLPTCA